MLDDFISVGFFLEYKRLRKRDAIESRLPGIGGTR